MLKFIGVLILCLCSKSLSFPDSMHVKLMENAVTIFQADTVIKKVLNKYKVVLNIGVQSPNHDYSYYKRHMQKLLPVLKGKGFAKSEHVLDHRIPKVIEDIVMYNYEKGLKIKFQYADEAIVDWFNKAVYYYKTNDIMQAMWLLGRCCHLIQDITDPVNCNIEGSYNDIWRILEQKEFTDFEKYCQSNYLPSNINLADIKGIRNLDTHMWDIAKVSRKIAKKYSQSKDYSEYAEIINNRAEINTCRLIKTFFLVINRRKV